MLLKQFPHWLHRRVFFLLLLLLLFFFTVINTIMFLVSLCPLWLTGLKAPTNSMSRTELITQTGILPKLVCGTDPTSHRLQDQCNKLSRRRENNSKTFTFENSDKQTWLQSPSGMANAPQSLDILAVLSVFHPQIANR